MTENVKLTPEEIRDLKVKFEELVKLFEKNHDEFLLFKSTPVRYLRDFGIDVMKYINNSVDSSFVSSLRRNIWHVLRYKNVLDRCSWCKILVLVVVYATCGKARLALDGWYGVVSGIIGAVKEIFNTSNEMVQRVLGILKNLHRRLSPFVMARLICEHLGYCD